MDDTAGLLTTLFIYALIFLGIYAFWIRKRDTNNKPKIKKDHSKGWRIFWKTVLFFALGALFNIFGLIAWLIILFCWKGKEQSQNNSNKYQELYYKELYKEKKRENERNMYQNEEETKQEEKDLEKLIEILESKKDKNKSPEE